MKGIQYVIDGNGDKNAVVIDLRHHRELWEDLYDAMIAKSRRREPRESLARVKQRLQRAGKLKRNG